MTGSTRFLPYGRQCIEDDDVEAVARVLRSDWLTTGPTVQEFESAFMRHAGSDHAIACSNGTAALHLAALALELQPGDRVVVPTVTFLATANAVRYVGGEVVFSDVDPDSGLVTPETLEAAIARADGPVKAVFPVHLGGQCADMRAIHAMASARGMYVVEDACHALGSTYHGNGPAVGSCIYSDMTCFSFHPVKTIAMGEGGLVTTNRPEMAERLSRLRSHGMVRDAQRFEVADMAYGTDGAANPWYYEMPVPGYNYRASDINCALGLSQLRKLGRFADRRKQLVALYDQALGPLAPVVRPVSRRGDSQPVWHLYQVLIDFSAIGQSRARVMDALRARGIGSQVHYIPVHLQPYYRHRYGDLSLPGASAFYERHLSLPLYVGMGDNDVVRVVSALADIAKGLT